MDIDKDIEAELAELMVATTKGLNPPPGIIEQGVRRGRRLQLVNRIRGGAAAIGVLAVTAGATFGAVAVADRPAGTDHALGATALSGSAAPSASGLPSASAAPSASGLPSASAGPATPTATPTSTPSATKHRKSGTRHVHLSRTQVEAVLADLLPPGRFAPLSPSAGGGVAYLGVDTDYWANYFPGTLGYQVSVNIVPSGSPDAVISSCSGWSGGDDGPRPAGATPASCKERNLPGGAHALVVVTGADLWGFYDYQVDLDRADGMQVTISIGNGTTDGPRYHQVTVNAPIPPITVDQLLTIAESDRWN